MPLRPPAYPPVNQRDWDQWARAVAVVPDPDSVGEDELQDAGVTYAKIQNVSASPCVLGRVSPGPGVIEEVPNEQLATLLEHGLLGGLGDDDHPQYMLKDESSGPGVISGGVISDGGGGTINVSAMTGFIRSADSANAPLVKVSTAAVNALALTDGVLSYIYFDYNAGTPQILASASIFNRFDRMIFGYAMRSGASVTFTTAPIPAANAIRETSRYLQLSQGATRATGLITTETGTRNLINTAGYIFLGMNEFVCADVNTSSGDTFTAFYRNGSGGWTSQLAQTQYSNTQYDDGSGALATLASGRHSVHWIFRTVDGRLCTMYGQSDYTLAQAQAAGLPAQRPPDLQYWHAVFVAKLIFQKNDAAAVQIDIAFSSNIGASAASDHGSLGGLTDDDHPQYPLAAGTETISGAWTFSVQLLLPAGGVAFATDTDTSIGSATADTIELKAGNTISTRVTSQGVGVGGKAAFSTAFPVLAYGAAGNGAFIAEDSAVADGGRPFWWWRSNGGSLEIGNSNRSGVATTSSTVRLSLTSTGDARGTAGITSNSASAGVGYATGAGGAVTQATSRTTGVTLNRVCGAITLVSAAGSTSWQSFTVTNSAVAATDVVKVCQKSGTDKNLIHVTAVAAGSFEITFATTGGTTVEQPVFNFAVIKAVAA